LIFDRFKATTKEKTLVITGASLIRAGINSSSTLAQLFEML
jgi:hypothetical protein